jgi:hypothetical protein
MVFTLNDSLIIDGIGNVGIGTMPKSSFDISTTNSALTIPGGTTLQRINNEGMFRFNTETELYELYRLGSWSSFAMVPTIASVNTQVLKNKDSSLTVTGSSFHSSAQWRFIGNSKKQYIPKSVTSVSDSSVSLVRPDIFPVSDAPYQIQCRQMGKVVYFSPITAGIIPVFVSAAGLLATVFVNKEYTTLIPAASIVVQDDTGGGIASITLNSGAFPSGLSGTYQQSGSNASLIVTGTSTDVVDTTYPFSLTAIDIGGNSTSIQYSLMLTSELLVPKSGLFCFLDMNDTRSYTSGTTFSDLSGQNKNFTFAGTPSVGTESTQNNLKYFVASGGASGQMANGHASNSFGITNSTGYTIIYLAKTMASGSYGGAFKFYGTGHATQPSLERAIFVHPVWGDNNMYWDQGGCCNSDSRLSVSIANNYNKYSLYILRCDRTNSRRTIWVNGVLFATNTTTPANINLSASAVQIGGNNLPDAYTWNARMSIFIVYNRPLTDTEVVDISNTFKTKYAL